MGKGGRGAKAKAPSAAPVDEDALLEAAIATAKAEKIQLAAAQEQKAKEMAVAAQVAAKAKAGEEGKVLTMKETLEKLDKVMVFTISRLLPDGSKDACPSSAGGAVTFYTDMEDAKADLAAAQKAEPEAKLGMDYTPLGRAFALTQGMAGLQTPGPTRLQFSRATVKHCGEDGVPPELRERMRSAGPFPLFYSDKLGSEQFTPVFFAVSDLREFWCTCGGDPKNPPTPTVTDLRIVVARTLQEPGQWEPLHYIPLKSSEPLMKELGARIEREAALKGGFTRGAAMLAAVAHAEAVKAGDEPPALT